MFYTAWTHLLNRHSVTVFDRDRCFFSFHPPKWPNLFEVQNVLQLPVDRPITFFTLKGQSSKIEKCKNQFFVLTLPQVLQFALRPNYSLLAPLLPRSIFKVERSKVQEGQKLRTSGTRKCRNCLLAITLSTANSLIYLKKIPNCCTSVPLSSDYILANAKVKAKDVKILNSFQR